MDAVEDCRRQVKVRLTKARECGIKIEQMLGMGLGEDPQSTRYG